MVRLLSFPVTSLGKISPASSASPSRLLNVSSQHHYVTSSSSKTRPHFCYLLVSCFTPGYFNNISAYDIPKSMTSLDLFNDDVKFRGINTPRGNVMVSCDLLTPSTRIAKMSDVYSSRSVELDNNESPDPYLLPTVSRPTTSRDNAILRHGEALAMVHRKASSTVPADRSPNKHVELCSTEPNLCLPASVSSTQTRDEMAIAATQSPNLHGKAESACCYAPKSNCRVRILPISEQPMATTTTGYSNLRSEGYVLDENNKPIPSYMSTNAIRARRLILKCDLPHIKPNRKSRYIRQRASVCEAGQHSKRPKLMTIAE